ncbi:MAG: histidine kinase [Saprospiraceae bacterium]|nr:histidine kinase [Saprospiraceae bacterium]
MPRLLTLFFALLLGQAAAQQPRFFQHFQEREGLSSKRVQCLLRDRQGFLWVGTEYGLNRFDGYSFRHYLPEAGPSDRSISSEIIHDLQQDSAGFIWIATSKGLNRYDPVSGRFAVWQNTGRADGSIPNSLVWNTLCDSNDRLWLCCDNRDLACFDTRRGSFQTFPWKAFAALAVPEKAATSYKSILRLSRKSPHELWLHTNLGLFWFDTQTQLFGFAGQTPAPEYLVDGQVWSIGPRGLLLPGPATGASLATGANVPHGPLQTILQEPGGVVWLGGAEGLWRYDPQQQHFRFSPTRAGSPAPDHNTVLRVLDSRVDGRRYVLDTALQEIQVFRPDGTAAGRVAVPGEGKLALLEEDRHGQLWTGRGKRLYRLDRRKLRLVPFPVPPQWFDPATPAAFVALAEDAQGRYWFGLNGAGVLIWDPSGEKWQKPGEAEGFIAQNTSALLADPARKTMWVGTEDYGLFRFDEGQQQCTLYRFEEDQQGCSLGAYMVNGLCRDGLGNIWVATDPGGLSRFEYAAPADCPFRTFSTQQGLPSNKVFRLATDRQGNVWAGTAKGLAWIDAQTLRLRAFDHHSGLPLELPDMGLSASPTGEMLLGAAQGLVAFWPERVLAEEPPARILITSFSIFDREKIDSLNINFLQEINLASRDNFFAIGFSSTQFLQPEKNRFQYRLSGFDADWVTANESRRAAYTNVPPGRYWFELRTGREGRWDTVGYRLAVYVRPAFWQTLWFKFLLLAGAAGLGVGAYRFRIGQIRKEEGLKSEFAQHLAKVEMSALRAQMNPHFVFNCLSSINRFILVNETDQASMYLTKFSRLIRLILDNSRSETITLAKEIEALRLYIEMEVMRFSGRFSYEIDVEASVQAEHLEVPPLLIQPFVENAIWHGLMHRKEGGHLRIAVAREGGFLHLQVEDNGIGRQQAAELKSRETLTHRSHGMQVTAERVQIINQLYDARASVDIEDLPQGTRVHLRLSL